MVDFLVGWYKAFFFTHAQSTSGISDFCRATFTFSTVHFHIFVGPLLPFLSSVFAIFGIFSINFFNILAKLTNNFIYFCHFYFKFPCHVAIFDIYVSHRANFCHIVQCGSHRANMPASLACVKKALVHVRGEFM